MYNIHLYLDITNPALETSTTLTKAITITFSKDAIISESSNPELWEALKRGLVSGFDQYIKDGTVKAFGKSDAESTFPSSTEGNGYRLHPEYLYVVESETVDDAGVSTKVYSGVKTFNEFTYFTNFFTDDCVGLFAENPVLEEITLPEDRNTIAKRMFSNCTNLKKVSLNSKTQDVTIETDAFSSCKNLETVDVGGMLSVVEGNAFYFCESLENIGTTDRLTKIGANAFYYCTRLTNIDLTDKVSYIGPYAFYNCNKLSEIHIPKNSECTKIEEWTFGFCRGIKNIEFPDNIKTIGSCAFSSSGLQTVNLNKIEAINERAFYASELQSLYIPSTVTYIGVSAFSGNSNLTEFTGDSVYNPVKWSETEQGSPYLITDPQESRVGDDVTTTYVLKEVAGGITEFDFPENIRAIGEYAFYVCTRLRSISIPNRIENNIGNYAFYSCTQLKTAVLPYDMITIPVSLFGFCQNLTELYIRSGSSDDSPGINDLSKITSLGSGAFYWCNSIENLCFKDLKSVSDSAFYHCLKLSEITVNNSTPPSISSNNTFGMGFGSYTGSSVPEIQRILYIPAGSESAYKNTWWNHLYEDCGFTISATL